MDMREWSQYIDKYKLFHSINNNKLFTITTVIMWGRYRVVYCAPRNREGQVIKHLKSRDVVSSGSWFSRWGDETQNSKHVYGNQKLLQSKFVQSEVTSVKICLIRSYFNQNFFNQKLLQSTFFQSEVTSIKIFKIQYTVHYIWEFLNYTKQTSNTNCLWS